MKIFGIKVPFTEREKKQSFVYEWPVPGMLGEFLGTEHNLSHYQIMKYYEGCQPVATVIDIIVDALVNLPLRIEIEKKIQEKHEILSLLTTPHPDYSGRLFMSVLVTHFLLTGECYVFAGGNFRIPPRILAPISPNNLNVIQGDDGFVSSFEITGLSYTGKFKRHVKNNTRLYLANPIMQIKQIRRFTTHDNSQLRGQSKLLSAVIDIKQHISGGRHNYRTLTKGGRLTMLFSIKDDMSNTRFREAKNQIINEFAGDTGGNSIAVVNSNQLDVTEMGKSNRDMDFAQLQSMTEKAIAKRYNVPIPLISDEMSTYNNLTTAYEALYDNAVIPVANQILDGLSDFLFPRFNLNPQLARLIVDTSEIAAISKRQAEIAEKRRKSYVWTDNELRTAQGLKAMQNGDRIFRPSSWVNDDEPIIDEEIENNVRLVSATDNEASETGRNAL